MSADSFRQPLTLSVAAAKLAEKINQVEPGSGWHRIALPVCVETDLLACLAGGEGVRVYWSQRDTPGQETAGFGVALALNVAHTCDLDECLPVIRNILNTCPQARFVGGLPFFEDRKEQWPGFEGGELILPRFELTRRQGQLTLACHVELPAGAAGEQFRSQIARQALSLKEAKGFPCALPSAEIVKENPDWQLWQNQVGQVLGLMEQDELEKLVLSREQQLELEADLCPWSLLSAWQKLTPETYRFAFIRENGQCFFGASPERLYRRNGQTLDSEALAGTAPRGLTPAQDRRLASALLSDDKNRRENSLVLQAVRHALQSCSESVEPISEMSLIRLKSVQHLRQMIRAKLKPGVTDGMLLKLLHPTPAVGGVPKDRALEQLATIENHARGWYAAPFGCIGNDQAEFAVALRCVFLNGRNLSLYSGAGLVCGSDANAEWAELDSKLRTVQSLLQISQ
ncbi:isochorismate synthase [Sansalvadorimonas sp. 2012CJ34-2]|uniref:Isochorismate synthase MenF n=1 Tax=Parendozoicomonas callyspongiae TaxID=2942213 RepID=A0ABT0PFZ3_9GAMM|nr:isochorismate synthase [Sansalvadorimonas sp. 2012CJ34-2]MCL6269443.1 isochorismate synthase [Sansalvadorimonas sp. 2012CJ34-2]